MVLVRNRWSRHTPGKFLARFNGRDSNAYLPKGRHQLTGRKLRGVVFRGVTLNVQAPNLAESCRRQRPLPITVRQIRELLSIGL